MADAVLALAAALREAGAQVLVVHTGPVSAVDGTWRAGARWGLRALLRAAGVLRAADVVHVQFAPSMYRYHIAVGLLPLVLGRRAPLVTTLHEYGWWTWAPRVPDRVWQALERRGALDRESALLVPAAREVVTTNAAHEHAVRTRFGDRIRTARIPVGANVAVRSWVGRTAARRALRRDLGLAADTTVVAFFGFVHPVKGVRYLIDAIAALRGEGRDLHLLVVGGFESMALPGAEAAGFEREVRDHVAAADMAAHTTITGWLPADEVSRLLLAADLGALPFTAGVTGKSGSLVALLAHGLPTVVTAADPPDDSLVDGRTGVTVRPVRDAAAIAGGLRRLLDDPALVRRVRAGGRAMAAERDWAAIAAQHLALYERVLAGRR